MAIRHLSLIFEIASELNLLLTEKVLTRTRDEYRLRHVNRGNLLRVLNRFTGTHRNGVEGLILANTVYSVNLATTGLLPMDIGRYNGLRLAR